MGLDGHAPLTHIPILVEYYPYGRSLPTTVVRTDVAVGEALESKKTLCEIAVEYCREGGMDVTGHAKISDMGIWAPC